MITIYVVNMWLCAGRFRKMEYMGWVAPSSEYEFWEQHRARLLLFDLMLKWFLAIGNAAARGEWPCKLLFHSPIAFLMAICACIFHINTYTRVVSYLSPFSKSRVSRFVHLMHVFPNNHALHRCWVKKMINNAHDPICYCLLNIALHGEKTIVWCI